MNELTRLLFATSLLLAASGSAFAQDAMARHPLLEDDWFAAAGLFVFDRDINLSINGQSTENLKFDFDERTQLSKSDSRFSANLRWRFGEKWSVAAQYFDSQDSNRAELTEDIDWRDVVLQKGTFAEAGVSITVSRLFFGRTFSTGPNHEFGLGAGIHWLEIAPFIQGEAILNDESTGLYRDSVSASAPLPNIGAWYMYAFTPKWLVDGRVDWLSASFQEYSGDLWNLSAGVQFQAFEHLGFGLQYQYFSLDVDVDKDEWRGGAELRFNGPYLSATVNW
jgi:hypothetical protein